MNSSRVRDARNTTPFARVVGATLLWSAPLLSLLACNHSPKEADKVVVDAAARPLTMQELLAGNQKAPLPGPPTDADFVKVGSREPDWDLDAADPARDYVNRYILTTKRYGAETACVHAQASRRVAGRTLVETRDSDENGCKGTNAVRDTFAVDTANNRMDLADPAVGKPLADWPDGSGPTTLPGPEPKEGPLMNEWNTELRQELKGLQLVPLRVQFYGRGSYPLVSVAGWHATVTPTSTPAQLDDVAKRVCASSAQLPVGILASGDRSRVLRVQCPAQWRWQTL